jgi:DNA-binding transcriptional MerR regulator
MRIGELAEASGVSARSLRYYEGLGLIHSERTAGGWRDFDPEMIERVVLIQHLFAAGLATSTIDEVLPCLEAPPEKRNGVMEQLLAQEAERIACKQRELDRELEVLQALRRDTALPGTAFDGAPNPSR